MMLRHFYYSGSHKRRGLNVYTFYSEFTLSRRKGSGVSVLHGGCLEFGLRSRVEKKNNGETDRLVSPGKEKVLEYCDFEF